MRSRKELSKLKELILESEPTRDSEKRTLKVNVISYRLILFIVGTVFGFATMSGIGLDVAASSVIAAIVGLGVLLTGSLVSYLVLQTIVLSLFASVSFITFRVDQSYSIEAATFHALYLTLIFLAPSLVFLKGVRLFLKGLEGSLILQLVGSVSFLALVLFLKVSRPSDAAFALSSLYAGEDNAGIVDVLTRSLEEGYAPHVSRFGEFMNGIYLATAGQIASFGNQEDLALISPLTHFNLTTLFMAWAPIAALCAIVLSGRKLGRTAPLTLGVMTVSLVLLMWPFIGFGHTSVVTSGLFALCLVAVTLNRDLALRHPLIFTVFAASLGAVIGSTWFPLLPFVVFTIALVVGSILLAEYRKGNKLILAVLIAAIVVMSLSQLPTVTYLLGSNTYYLQLQGGTRAASDLLVLIWLGIASFAIWQISRPSETQPNQNLFTLTVAALVASNGYLFLTGISTNAGSAGYGATKYLITSIAFSIPLFWMLALHGRKGISVLHNAAFGIILLFAILIAQPDVRSTAIGFLSPPQNVDVKVADTGVVHALKVALERKPDHVLCVSDFGFPLPGAEVRMESYLCTRWAQSLVGGDAESDGWRFVPLGRLEESYMSEVLDAYSDKEVVLIRFTDASTPMAVKDTWWAKYTVESWEVIEVGN